MPKIPDAYTLLIWRPSLLNVPPPLLRTPVNWVWWLFHNLRIFRSRSFRIIALENSGRIVHRSTVFPPYFRFPFMRRDDAQIGDTWTHPSQRGLGLAGVAIRVACAESAFGGVVWYIAEENNAPSIRVIEKEGFELLGRGSRVPRVGMRILGCYTMVST
jgi:RimJ/RimL family protein N-acetyltransferase